jgi:type VI secretion system VgrG family protein
LSQATFKFTSDATGGDQFTVVSFTGRERISELYRYEIEVKAPLSADIDLDNVLDGLVHFVTEQNGVKFPVHGILSSFEEFKTVLNYAYYKAILVPSIWKLSNYKTNEIFYRADPGFTITDIITQVLKKSNMASADFDLTGLSDNKLLKREYTCQYGESDFNFISRLMENEGVFYYFEQSATEEKIVFINDQNYPSLPRPKLIFDVAAMASSQDDGVFGWSCRKQRQAERVVVRNYNPEEPSLDVSDTTAIDPMGQGTEYIYGQNVQTDIEATTLSQIRAEEHICRKTQFFGESSATRLQAGYEFSLGNHPNTKYNTTKDNPTGYLTIEVNHEGHGLDMSIAHDANKQTRPQYQNSFIAISAVTQFRPPLKTKKPRITGTLHARIDGELDSGYAQLDSEGRYKVSLPFDFQNEEHSEGLASARVRMIQPYAGEDRGMQFPLEKGTEVLLSFIDGDPDRPIIAGAINTTAAPGPVSADNQTESVIQTGGNNKLRMQDKVGEESIILETPKADSCLRMGSPNEALDLGDDGIRLSSSGSIWTEALGKYGNYIAGAPKDDAVLSSSVDYQSNTSVSEMLGFFLDGKYKPSGLLKYIGGDDQLQDALNKAHIKVSSLDTFTTQEGNIYDFGGYWNYNLGNSYAENHLNQSAILNKTGATGFVTGALEEAVSDTWITVDEGGVNASSSMMVDYVSDTGLEHILAVAVPTAVATLAATCIGSKASIITMPIWAAANVAAAYGIGLMISEYVTVPTSPSLGANIGNVIDSPGSNKPIATWADRVGSSFDLNGVQTDKSRGSKRNTAETTQALQMNTDTTWVDKSYGDSYSYTQGNSIEITHGNTEEHVKGDQYEFKYGGLRESTSFNGKGVKTAWEKSGGGESHEMHWDAITAQFVSYEYKNRGHLSFSVTAPSLPKLAISIGMSSLNASLGVSVGTSMDIKVAAAMAVNVSLTAGLSIDFERSVGGKFLNDETTNGFEFKAVGMAAKKKAEIESEKANVKLANAMIAISKDTLIMDKALMKMVSGEFYVNSSKFKFF